VAARQNQEQPLKFLPQQHYHRININKQKAYNAGSIRQNEEIKKKGFKKFYPAGIG